MNDYFNYAQQVGAALQDKEDFEGEKNQEIEEFNAHKSSKTSTKILTNALLSAPIKASVEAIAGSLKLKNKH